jgi:hypothetical protein
MLLIFSNVVDVDFDGGVNIDVDGGVNVDVDGGGSVVVGSGDDCQYDHDLENKRLCCSFFHSICSSNKYNSSPLPSRSMTTIHSLMNSL